MNKIKTFIKESLEAHSTTLVTLNNAFHKFFMLGKRKANLVNRDINKGRIYNAVHLNRLRSRN